MIHSKPAPPDTLEEQLQQAIALQQAGAANEAIPIYEELLAIAPKDIRAMAFYAAALQQIGQVARSVALFREVIALDPTHVHAQHNLGLGLEQLGKWDEAVIAYDRALAINPDYVLGYVSRAKVLLHLGQINAAKESLRSALQRNSEDAEANFCYAKLLFERGEFEAALPYFQCVRSMKPDWAAIYFYLGSTAYALNRLEESVSFYEQATQCDPNFTDAHANKGVALLDQSRVTEAITSFQAALAIEPRLVEAHLNLGNAHGIQGNLTLALHHYDQAIALDPQCIDAHNNRGATLQEHAQYGQALACYEKALRIAPDHAKTQWNKALCSLLLGNFEAGWPLYESGWLNGMRGVRRSFQKPLWLGKESIAGKTLLIYAEQGLGDTLMFMRYALVLEEMGATVVLDVPEALFKVTQSLPFKQKASVLIKTGAACPDYDYQCPLMSLPLALKTRIDSIPVLPAYLFANSLQIKQWQARLKRASSLHIGIAWSGRPDHQQDRHRSIALAELAPLFSMPIEWYSLQKEYRPRDLAELEKIDPLLHDHSSELKDFSDTTALIHHLDLVISVDTAVAHLAAAMGKPTWVLITNSPDFRWLLDRDNSPWYPSVRLIRQEERGNWAQAIEETKALLSALIHRTGKGK